MRSTSQISTAVTFSSQCARSLLDSVLQSLHHKPPSPNTILLFTFAPSPTTSPDVLSQIISTLTQLHPRHVGCISAPLPYQCFNTKLGSKPHSCSLAYAFVDGVSFRSTIPGRAQTQVGRWHASRNRGVEDVSKAKGFGSEESGMRILDHLAESDSKVDWKHIWDRRAAPSFLSSSGNGIESDMLPDGLENVDPTSINNIFYLSDTAPEGLANVLQGNFPQANKFSLIASSTPFITGRPVTLFYNGLIASNGAVGIAFSSPPPRMVDLCFPPLVALGRTLEITSSEGNLILSLDSENPAQLLLSAIRKHGLSSSHEAWVRKEDEFYVGVMDPSSQQISQLYRINAGDPSRGTIALDCDLAPKEGSAVCLYHLPKDSMLPYLSDDTSSNISLFVAPEVVPSEADNIGMDGERPIISNAFLAASENGFTVSCGTQRSWKCLVPGGRLRLSL